MKAETQAQPPEKPYKAELEPFAKKIADQTIFSIQNFVPESVEGMPYSRQYVLEEVIKILQDRV